MARTPKPWYRASRDAFFVEVAGKQVLLARGKANKPQAMKAFHRLMADGAPPSPDAITVALACDRYLDHSQAVHKPATYQTNRLRLQRAVDQFGRVKVAQLSLSAVERWLAAIGGSSATRRAYGVALKAALR